MIEPQRIPSASMIFCKIHTKEGEMEMSNILFEKDFNRRDFLRLSAGTAAALTVGTMMPATGMAKGITDGSAKMSLADCVRLEPAAMAERSAMVKKGYDYLLKCSNQISDTTVRSVAIEGLKNPVPKLMELFPTDGEKEVVRQKLVDAGYLKNDATYDQFLPPCKGLNKNVQPFYTAPGSGWKSHHAYPGGLVTHVAVDMKTALGIYDAYYDIYGYRMNKELIISAILIHDIQKAWVLQWKEDGSCLPEVNVAGTGVHHVLAIADTIYRGLSPELIVAIACSHNHPGWTADEAQVIGWIKAACLLVNKDAVKLGLLAPDGNTLPLPRRQEGFMVHLGDHDYVLTAPAASWMVTKLSEIAKKYYSMSDEDLKGKPFNAFRNYLFSQVSVKRLHQVWVENGENVLCETIKNIISV